MYIYIYIYIYISIYVSIHHYIYIYIYTQSWQRSLAAGQPLRHVPAQWATCKDWCCMRVWQKMLTPSASISFWLSLFFSLSLSLPLCLLAVFVFCLPLSLPLFLSVFPSLFLSFLFFSCSFLSFFPSSCSFVNSVFLGTFLFLYPFLPSVLSFLPCLVFLFLAFFPNQKRLVFSDLFLAFWHFVSPSLSLSETLGDRAVTWFSPRAAEAHLRDAVSRALPHSRHLALSFGSSWKDPTKCPSRSSAARDESKPKCFGPGAFYKHRVAVPVQFLLFHVT